MIAMGVSDDDVGHRLAAHGVKERSRMAAIERPRIDDRDLAAADDIGQRPREGERAWIIGEDTPHAGRNVVDDARSEVERALERDVFGHSGMTFWRGFLQKGKACSGKTYIPSFRGSAVGREPGIHNHRSGSMDSGLASASLRRPGMTRLTEHISIKRPASSRPAKAFFRSTTSYVPTRSGTFSLRSAAMTESAVIRPVLGFSDGTFSIENENRAESESTSMEWQFRVTAGSAHISIVVRSGPMPARERAATTLTFSGKPAAASRAVPAKTHLAALSPSTEMPFFTR